MGLGGVTVAIVRIYTLPQLIILGIYHMEIMPRGYKNRDVHYNFRSQRKEKMETAFMSTERQRTSYHTPTDRNMKL